MKILVTGGSGFIGSHLVEELNVRGYEVISYDVHPSQHNNAKTIIGSILDSDKLSKVIIGCDFVFHLAGMLGTHELVDCAIEATQVNVIGTRGLQGIWRKISRNFKTELLGKHLYHYESCS